MTLALVVALSYSAGVGAINTNKLLAAYYEHVKTPSIDMEVYAYSAGGNIISDETYAEWRHEIARKYRDAVVIVCHGADINGQWMFVPQRVIRTPIGIMVQWGQPFPVEDGIRFLRQKYGMRRIVLLTCNPGHHRLSWRLGPVTYALDNVFIEPDKMQKRSKAEPQTVGNISDFIE